MALLLVSQHLGDDLLMTLYLHSWDSSNLQNTVETARAVTSDFTGLAQCPQCACLVTQPWLTLCYPMYHSLPCSSDHEISQARLPEWVAIFSSEDLPSSGIEPAFPESPVFTGTLFTTEPPRKLMKSQHWL